MIFDKVFSKQIVWTSLTMSLEISQLMPSMPGSTALIRKLPATAFMEQHCFFYGGVMKEMMSLIELSCSTAKTILVNTDVSFLICASPKPRHSYWRVGFFPFFKTRYRTVNRTTLRKMLLLCLPQDKKWQCGWFENERENNLASSETLSQSDGTHKSLISKPKTELNEYTHGLQILGNKYTHANVITEPRLTVTCLGWLKIKSVWKRPRLAS